MTITISDFWRMIWENKSAVIVLLSDPKHDDKVTTIFTMLIDVCDTFLIGFHTVLAW